LLVLEFNLSRKHGLELVQWARSNEKLRDLLIVFLTSSSHPDYVRQAYNAGANSFLTKPPGYDEYLALIRSFEEYWMGWNECPQRTGWQGQR
jgi:CheY-like chemotaxis protein